MKQAIALGAAEADIGADLGQASSSEIVAVDLERNRCVREPLVGLRLGPLLVLRIEIFDRALAQERARQDHHADEPGGTIARPLRENRVGSGFMPGAARAVAGRGPVGVDPNTAFEQATNAGTLMPMQKGAAARRKRHA